MMKNKVLKSNYKKDFQILTKLLNEFDPCALIVGGAPNDEYDCLTGQILSLVYKKADRTVIKDKIIYEIEHHFGFPNFNEMNDDNKLHFYEKLNGFIEKIKNEIIIN